MVGEERRRRAASLDQGIGEQCRGMDHPPDVRRAQACRLDQGIDRVHDPQRGVIVSGQNLRAVLTAVGLRDRNHVGEGAANIDAD